MDSHPESVVARWWVGWWGEKEREAAAVAEWPSLNSPSQRSPRVLLMDMEWRDNAHSCTKRVKCPTAGEVVELLLLLFPISAKDHHNVAEHIIQCIPCLCHNHHSVRLCQSTACRWSWSRVVLVDRGTQLWMRSLDLIANRCRRCVDGFSGKERRRWWRGD